MELEVLLSTMNKRNKNEALELFKSMNIKGKVLVINQITNESIDKTVKKDGDKKIYSYYEKGLSKSRNRAIEKMTGDIGILADDDVIYNDNYEKTIKKAYEKYPDADIIAFDVKSMNKKRQTRKQPTHKANFITLMRIQSVQITFRKDRIIRFDEDFGIGAKYKLGEENILLYDCRRMKRKIYYVDENIATVKQEESRWFSKMDRDFLKCEGAVFYRISPRFYWLLILQYAIRKRKQYKDNTSFMEAVKCLFKGAESYKQFKIDN